MTTFCLYEEMIVARLGETWQWLLAPTQPSEDPTAAMTWEEARLSGPDPVAVRASRRLISEEGLITEYSGVRLRMDLDRSRCGLKRPTTSTFAQLWDEYAK